MKKYTVLSAALIALAACSTAHKTTSTATQSGVTVDGKLWTSLFQQRAAEYKALCFQAYNIATLRLNESLQQSTAKPRAIVTDLDETALDNSPFAVHQGLQGKVYESAAWAQWTAMAAADTLAGAVTFFKYAAAHNVEVFYITNRAESERTATLQNLQRYGFPYADNAHLVLKPDNVGSSKEPRRQALSQTHDIILLLGDNLGDFSALFDKKEEAERLQNTIASAADFGKKFIVLPNANYGDWEGALAHYQRLTLPQQDSLVKASVKGY
ncbi:5'-nucleotidase, lipoprotein e(P4) family [Deminuibacter soli]|uniref:5'-nucleotidase, lipoprotein e(P4) family n=1 Tax=Deminuibacter soli TaxID=2291815 RepID=A0A3E1NJD3_9BACT|nr:5'-nucleotidase, lipoprotein e(P4) family [Deminuibacter soli]RFM28032.1 5'-nucleotidase, lipoprotein e(P4) family [Deminuibacter soli]